MGAGVFKRQKREYNRKKNKLGEEDKNEKKKKTKQPTRIRNKVDLKKKTKAFESALNKINNMHKQH